MPFTLPVHDPDAAPGILFEASVMGCNVVASKNCGNWELCNDRLLVRDYTADAFAKAILRSQTAKIPDHMDLFLDRSSYIALKDVLLNDNDYASARAVDARGSDSGA